VDEEDFAGLEAGAVLECEVGGEVDDGEGRGGGEVHGVGDAGDVLFLGDGLFGEAAVIELGEDAVAGGNTRDIRCYFANDAGDLHAGGEGQGWFLLVLASGDEGVGEVDAGGVDIDQDAAGSERRRIDFVDTEADEAGELKTADCAHRVSSMAIVRSMA